MVKFVTIIDLFSKLGQRSSILVCMKLFPQGKHMKIKVSRFSSTKITTNVLVCIYYLFSKVGQGHIFRYITKYQTSRMFKFVADTHICSHEQGPKNNML